MFTPEENKGSGEMDLDFTKPEALDGMEVHDYASVEEKITDLHNKIASAERGIHLAQSLNDSVRIEQMQAKKKEFEETLALLTSMQTPKEEPKRFETADLGDYLGADDKKFDRKTYGA